MAYEFPNWIQPPESLAKSYAAGVGISADLAARRASLDQEAQLAQQKARESQAYLELERQKQMADQAYRTQQLGMNQQELAMNQQLNQMKLREAQTMFDARREYQRRVAAGEDPMQAAIKIGPFMGENFTGYGQMLRQQRLDKLAQQPAQVVNYPDAQGVPHSFLRAPGSEGIPTYHNLAQQKDAYTSSMDLLYARQEYSRKNQIEAAIRKMDTDPVMAVVRATPKHKLTPIQQKKIDQYNALIDEVNDIQGNIDRFYQQRGYAQPGAVRSTGVQPPAGGNSVNMPRLISVRQVDGGGMTNAPAPAPSVPAGAPMGVEPTPAPGVPASAPMNVAPPTTNNYAISELGGVVNDFLNDPSSVLGPNANQRFANERNEQAAARRKLVDEALRELQSAPAVQNFAPDYTTGQNANPESYVPYDPFSGIPTYGQ